jgi:hypothetical protein
MKAELLVSILRFPAFRAALKKEAVWFFAGLAIGLIVVGATRWYLGRPYSKDGLISLGLGVATLVLAWTVAVVRTIRAVLREHGLLER